MFNFLLSIISQQDKVVKFELLNLSKATHYRGKCLSHFITEIHAFSSFCSCLPTDNVAMPRTKASIFSRNSKLFSFPPLSVCFSYPDDLLFDYLFVCFSLSHTSPILCFWYYFGDTMIWNTQVD
jgi:hypothetical protein